MLTNEDKKHVVNEYLRNIHHLSDKKYQRRAWICGQPPGTDFDEAVCQFIDVGDPILENYKDFWITDKQYLILKKFRDRFIDFSEQNGWPPEFIDTPEWNDITKMAKDVLKEFKYPK